MNPIFGQLISTESQHLRCIIEDWHLEYHTEEKAFTPSTLFEHMDKKCKALSQSNQLYSMVNSEIMVLVAILCSQPQLATSVFQALTPTSDAVKLRLPGGAGHSSQQQDHCKTHKPA
jgi:hypothetical protein